jgi:hypothetical protein
MKNSSKCVIFLVLSVLFSMIEAQSISEVMNEKKQLASGFDRKIHFNFLDPVSRLTLKFIETLNLTSSYSKKYILKLYNKLVNVSNLNKNLLKKVDSSLVKSILEYKAPDQAKKTYFVG